MGFHSFVNKSSMFLFQFYTPLMHACAEGHMERVKLLLDKGAKVGLIAGESKSINGKSVRNL